MDEPITNAVDAPLVLSVADIMVPGLAGTTVGGETTGPDTGGDMTVLSVADRTGAVATGGTGTAGTTVITPAMMSIAVCWSIITRCQSNSRSTTPVFCNDNLQQSQIKTTRC